MFLHLIELRAETLALLMDHKPQLAKILSNETLARNFKYLDNKFSKIQKTQIY